MTKVFTGHELKDLNEDQLAEEFDKTLRMIAAANEYTEQIKELIKAHMVDSGERSVEREFGTFYFRVTPPKYNFSEKIDTLKEEMKERKQHEIDEGIAEVVSEERDTLVFRQVK